MLEKVQTNFRFYEKRLRSQLTGEKVEKCTGRGHGVGSRKSLRECKLFETRNFLETTSKNTYIVDIFDHSKLVNVRLNNIVITYH